jgi:hypothetical protein
MLTAMARRRSDHLVVVRRSKAASASVEEVRRGGLLLWLWVGLVSVEKRTPKEMANCRMGARVDVHRIEG